MSIFYSKNPLVVNPELAEIVGLNEAIILQQIHYWLEKSNIVHEEKRWVYNSYKEWQKQFKFWSVDTIKRTLCELEKNGYIEKKRLSKNNFDKTNYYTINYHKIDIPIDEGKMHQSKSASCTNREGQNAPIDEGKMHQSLKNNNLITETNLTETTTETTNRERKEKDKSFSQKIKNFSFSLSKKFSFEALSKEYQDRLFAYAISKDSADSFEAFKDYHCSVGSKFKDWSRAYNTWLRNKKNYNQDIRSPRRGKMTSGEDIYLDISEKFAVKISDKNYKLLEIFKSDENYPPPEPIPKQTEPANRQEFQSRLKNLTERMRV